MRGAAPNPNSRSMSVHALALLTLATDSSCSAISRAFEAASSSFWSLAARCVRTACFEAMLSRYSSAFVASSEAADQSFSVSDRGAGEAMSAPASFKAVRGSICLSMAAVHWPHPRMSRRQASSDSSLTK